MKQVVVMGSALLAVGSALAGVYGDVPDAKHAWAVHDWNRPKPAKVEPAAYVKTGAPSDAIVLFDGTKESFEKNWCDKDGKPSLWKLGSEGDFYCVPGWKNGGEIRTRAEFGDCQLHIEYRHEADITDGGRGPQMRGNSGVFLMGSGTGYEIQVLESYYTSRDLDGKPGFVDNYTDGQAGSVYAENPPMVNPQRKPGEWQSYDIVFHPPVREGRRLVDPGSITVFFNGVLVQDDFPFQGTTTWCRRLKTHAEAPEAPLYLQDHGHPVPFRNVWIRRIPSRYADTVNGSIGTKYGDVAKLRHELAAQSLAFADATDDPAEKFIRLWESYCYEPDRKVKHLIDDGEDATVKALANGQGSFGDPRRFNAFRRFVKMLVDSGWLAKDAKIAVQLGKMPAPPKPKAPNMRDF